jgi:molecular chaperone DnaJ
VPTDAYELLGVPRTADETQIKKAFRKLARELHPDVSKEEDAESRFKEVAEAYEILSDPERRATYDRYGYEGLRSGGYNPTDFGAFGGLSDILDAFFGGGGGGGIFGGGRGGPRAGGDVAARVELELADVLSDTQTDVVYEAVERCSKCHGNGAEPGTPITTCERCGGAGRLQAVSRTPFGQVVRQVECDVCHGDGRVPEQPVRPLRRPRASRSRSARCRSTSPPASRTASASASPATATRGRAGRPAATCTSRSACAPTRASSRRGRPGHRARRRRAAGRARRHVHRRDARGLRGARGRRRHPARRGAHPARPRDAVAARPRAARGPARRRQRRHPARLSRDQQDLLRRLADTLTDEHVGTDESVFDKLRRSLRGRA